MYPRIAAELGVERRDELAALAEHDGAEHVRVGGAEGRVCGRRRRDALGRQACEDLGVCCELRIIRAERERVHARGADENRVERLVRAREQRRDRQRVLERLELA